MKLLGKLLGKLFGISSLSLVLAVFSVFAVNSHALDIDYPHIDIPKINIPKLSLPHININNLYPENGVVTSAGFQVDKATEEFMGWENAGCRGGSYENLIMQSGAEVVKQKEEDVDYAANGQAYTACMATGFHTCKFISSTETLVKGYACEYEVVYQGSDFDENQVSFTAPYSGDCKNPGDAPLKTAMESCKQAGASKCAPFIYLLNADDHHNHCAGVAYVLGRK